MKWDQKRVLVTGGAGFIGSHLVEKLLDLGATLTVIDKMRLGTNKLWDLKLSNYTRIWQERDYRIRQVGDTYISNSDHLPLLFLDLETEKNRLLETARDHDVIFHLSAVFGGRGFVDERQADCAIGFAINHNVIDTASQVGARIHFASSACVYPPSLNLPDRLLTEDDILSTGEAWASSDNVYGFVKLMGELELKAYHEQHGLEGSTCRYLTVYGPQEYDQSHAMAALIRKALNRDDPFVVWGSGLQERGFTYVTDIVDGTILATEKIADATPINLGWDKRYKIKDVVGMILDFSDHKPQKTIFDRSKPEGPFSRALDVTRANRLLGWNPKIDLPEGLKKTVIWAKAEYEEGHLFETSPL